MVTVQEDEIALDTLTKVGFRQLCGEGHLSNALIPTRHPPTASHCAMGIGQSRRRI